MNIAADIVEKYTDEQIVAYLDSILGGILQNYKTAIKANQPQILFSNIGDITQAKEILHEMRRQDELRKAMKDM